MIDKSGVVKLIADYARYNRLQLDTRLRHHRGEGNVCLRKP